MAKRAAQASRSVSPESTLRTELAQAKSNKGKKKDNKGSTAGSSKGKKTSSARKENKAAAALTPEKKRRAPTIQWSKKVNFHLTDALLTIIEAKDTWRASLGFSTDAPTNSSGDRPEELYRKLARKLFVERTESGDWGEEDLKELKDVVKNRIHSLKNKFRELRRMMSATGQGLIEQDREAEITEGSDIDNLWQKIQRDFPWYKRMNALMGKNPIVDRSAVGNSTTPIDTSVLQASRTKSIDPAARHSSPWEIEKDTDDAGEPVHLRGSSAPTQSHAGSPGLDEDDEDMSDPDPAPPTQPREPSTVPATPSNPSPPSAAAPNVSRRKTKNHAESLTKLAEEERQSRKEIAAALIKSRDDCARADREKGIEIERIRWQEQRAEAERIRQHDLLMVERQIELARIQQGIPPTHTQFPPPFPPGAGPASNANIDPSFR
ncbi:hypothetical protein PLICRDRAFT_33215 [Plicaturopsis crispa FD-325 SS-3]|uniref:Uncharacterized protein n=1 Tax=Plicaturopsis crispa FD-325 SS-3 TaxID=944288 RepID=A0A0C9T409_PLICR|nr:hypothetical protein PLICRDRAFT_33215 [Plicaturopsis crispa FD-325 SS-3]